VDIQPSGASPGGCFIFPFLFQSVNPYSTKHTLDAFVEETNHVNRLRTDSSEFPLKDGYKVGDNAIEVLDFYASKYNYLDNPEMDYGYSEYTFILNNGHMLEFTIDSEELNQSSIISSISIDFVK